jgi:hypothetical protein
MANAHRGEVEITLDKKRILKFNHYAVAELEDALEMDINDIFQNTEIFRRTKVQIELLRACLKDEDETLTYKEVADMLDDVDAVYLEERLSLTFERSKYIQKLKKVAEEISSSKKKKTKSGTGMNSKE